MASTDVLRVLANKYNAEILSATRTPKSAKDLSDELDIPIATSYRRIEELTEADLLKLEEKTLSEEGRRTKVYRSNVDEIKIEFEDDGIDITVKERSEVKDKLANIWSDMKT